MKFSKLLLLLLVLLVIPVFLLILIIIFLFFLLKKKSNIINIIFIILFIIILIPFNYNFFIKDYNNDLYSMYGNIITKGTNQYVYKKSDSVLVKYISKYNSYPCFNLCDEDKCNLLYLLINKILFYINLENIKIMNLLYNKIPYIAKIYKIDNEKLIYEQEFINNIIEINKNISIENFFFQLNSLNNYLKKYDYYLFDFKLDNIGLDINNKIKLFDCYIVDKKELLILLFLRKFYKGKDIQILSNIYYYDINSI